MKLKTDWKTSDIFTASAANEIAVAINKAGDDIGLINDKLSGSSVPLTGIDGLISPDRCGEYSVIDAGHRIANLSVTTDSMKHVINQFIKTNLIPDEQGILGSTHLDSKANIYSRIYNIRSSNAGIDRGTWGKWVRVATEDDIKLSAENQLRYFGGYVDSISSVIDSTLNEDVSPENVFYTKNMRLSGTTQGVPSFVCKKGNDYYRSFKNIGEYSNTGINPDAGKTYIDINNNLMYFASPAFLYDVIRIGTKEIYLTQSEYDALGTYENDTRYYIIEE